MSERFEVRQGLEKELGGELTLIRDSFHKHLDELIDRFLTQGGSFGGAITVEGEDLDNKPRSFKLLFAESTGRKECPFCQGTGFEGC